jgi:3-hydroxyacyl-[acyl-carrier-protein] dehydratase
MDIHEVMKYLPHRFPFLLIDRVIEIVEGESLVALKNVTMNEMFFTGHFPNRPVMPGVLILEAMAQAGGVLAYKSTNTLPSDGVLYLFAGIDNARFRRVVEPGDQLRLEVKLTRSKREIWKLDGKAFVDGDLVCEAELISARRG